MTKKNIEYSDEMKESFLGYLEELKNEKFILLNSLERKYKDYFYSENKSNETEWIYFFEDLLPIIFDIDDINYRINEYIERILKDLKNEESKKA